MKLEQTNTNPSTRSELQFEDYEVIHALKEMAKKEGYIISNGDKCRVWHPRKHCEKTSLVIDKNGEKFAIEQE